MLELWARSFIFPLGRVSLTAQHITALAHSLVTLAAGASRAPSSWDMPGVRCYGVSLRGQGIKDRAPATSQVLGMLCVTDGDIL